MGVIGKILGGILLLIIIAAFGAFTWFWWKPVGINNYINKVTAETFLLDGPELLTSIGAIDNTPLDFHSGKLASYTKEQDEKTLAKLRKARAGLDKYGPEGLEGQELLSWEIMAWFMDDIIRQAEYEYGGYRVVQNSGVTVNMPSFLTDQHSFKNEKSVKRYISRLNEFGRVLREVKVRVEDDRDHGVVPPDFIIEKSLDVMRSFIEDGAAENPLVTILSDKFDEIELEEGLRADYIAQATKAVEDQVFPGYEAMIALYEELLQNTDHDAGIWRIPDGDKIYAAALKSNTTTDFTADEIHEIGLSEVARIEREMFDILVAEGKISAAPSAPIEDGSPEAAETEDAGDGGDAEAAEVAPTFDGAAVALAVKDLMTDPEYHFPNTDEGRKAMIDYLVALDDELMAKASDYFITLPPQPLEIVRVPEFSQDSAPGGYYNQPSVDGSRPGRFYINQKDTADNPKWTLPTLMYHEGAPGHHFQISSAMLIENIPFIRKFGLFTAYTEGWALYAERVAKIDMDMYADDPLGDLGRLQAEMFRAVRLVVDTGMHAKRWSREEAIEYMVAKTGMTEAEVTREIERYVVWPGQATAYKTGQLAMLKLRDEAEAELGDKFDLREFHETILMNGAMPLGLLEEVVDGWVAEKQGS